MDNTNIVAGISPGGLTDKSQAKVLICYMINSFVETLTKEQIYNVFEQEHLVNYFTFEEAIADLVDTKHIMMHELDIVDNLDKTRGSCFYTLGAIGKETALKLSHTIPKSIKEKAVINMEHLLNQIKTESENEVVITSSGSGYMVSMVSHDTDFDLMKLELFAPDMAGAKMIRKKFLKDPSAIYSGILSMFLED